MVIGRSKIAKNAKTKSLSGKVAFVTGGTGGIGKAICEELLKEGACVVAADRNLLDETQAELRKKYGKDSAISTGIDVVNAEAIAASFRNTILAFAALILLSIVQGFQSQNH